MTDKLLHFSTNLLSTVAVGTFSPQAGAAFSLGLSFGKEYGDWANYGQGMGFRKFAPLATHDMLYNTLGIAVGLGIALILHHLIFAD